MKQNIEVKKSDILYTVCKECRKCCNYCPAEINIPEMLKLYEICMAEQDVIEEIFDRADSIGQPIDCIECGACSSHCPQKIQVKQVMRKLAMRQSSQRETSLHKVKEV